MPPEEATAAAAAADASSVRAEACPATSSGHSPPHHQGSRWRRRRLRHYEPWRESNAVYECLTTRVEAPAPPPPGAAVQHGPPPLVQALVDQLPSAGQTWDWFSQQSRRRRYHAADSFVGGSALLGRHAKTADCSAARPGSGYAALASGRDPILEGDPGAERFRPGKRTYLPTKGVVWASQGEATEAARLSRRASRPAYDPTRAGVRTDCEKAGRPVAKRAPQPPCWRHNEEEDAADGTPRTLHRRNRDRSRDIILQVDDEFAESDSRKGIRTFPKHQRQSKGESLERHRPSRRLLGRLHEVSAERVMHYNLPVNAEAPPTHCTRDKNKTTAESVIQYRHSGGICPDDRVLRDTRPDRATYEQELNQCFDQLQSTRRMYQRNQSRANHPTSIY